ncbi:MAG TPA: NAD(P)-dependent oxidoreductase [Myxococcales bacterium]|jgi:3-hydroxyisobutyrate dehydrogenase-like beta-hydroxyacid dehydrogenase|nr:NAD(P)-dependent oxidoreductase [Myxococcales bacterium]
MDAIGFIGLGRMGRPMAANLVAAGFTVRTWNRTPGKAPPGAVECRSPREVAEQCAIVATMLADDAALEQVTFGDGGLLAGLRRGGIHVSMSTISVALSRKLREAHSAAGQGYVAAPVFGRPEAAQKKQLWIVCGGEQKDLAACERLFTALGRGTFTVAEAPQANVVKLIGNFLIATTIESLGEATAVAEKAGLDPTRLVEFFGGTMFGSTVFTGYGARVAATEFEPAGFAMPLALKDVTLALQAGHELRAPLPMASLLRDRLLAALARGRDGWDWSGLTSVAREEAGLPPRRT